MIKIDIDNKSSEPNVVHISGDSDELMREFYKLYEHLDKNIKPIFRASLYAYIDYNEDILKGYEDVQNSPLTKLIKAIIKKAESDDNN